MNVVIKEYTFYDLGRMTDIWNEVVDSGIAFPQMDRLTEESAAIFFSRQSFTGIAVDGDTGDLLGLYVLHPNNEGRCGHISNASFAVRSDARGRHVGENLVAHCVEKGRELGFRVLQFNAVVKTNHAAIHLYEKLGFVRLGEIPGGFLMKDGTYEDIVLFYKTLTEPVPGKHEGGDCP